MSLHYLVILDTQDRPILFKSYKNSDDDLNIQLHCYASLDFLQEKVQSKGSEYIGKIYTIYNQHGQYSIHAFYTATRIKIMCIFKQEGANLNLTINEEDVQRFCLNVYRLYKRQILQAFSVFVGTGRFHKRFYQQLDSYISKAKFTVVQAKMQ